MHVEELSPSAPRTEGKQSKIHEEKYRENMCDQRNTQSNSKQEN